MLGWWLGYFSLGKPFSCCDASFDSWDAVPSKCRVRAFSQRSMKRIFHCLVNTTTYRYSRLPHAASLMKRMLYFYLLLALRRTLFSMPQCLSTQNCFMGSMWTVSFDMSFLCHYHLRSFLPLTKYLLYLITYHASSLRQELDIFYFSWLLLYFARFIMLTRRSSHSAWLIFLPASRDTASGHNLHRYAIHVSSRKGFRIFADDIRCEIFWI